MPNVLSGRFRTGSPRPLRTFAPGQYTYRLPQLFNLGGMSMNIQLKNSAHHFRMQSSGVKNSGFVTNLWLTKFDGLILYFRVL